MTKENIIIGKKYGCLKVLSALDPHLANNNKYNVRCEKCGEEFIRTRFQILRRYAECCECGMRKFKAEQRKHLEQQYIGKCFGKLKIIAIVGTKPHICSNIQFVTAQCTCGQVKDYPLNKIITGQIKSCGHGLNEW